MKNLTNYKKTLGKNTREIIGSSLLSSYILLTGALRLNSNLNNITEDIEQTKPGKSLENIAMAGVTRRNNRQNKYFQIYKSMVERVERPEDPLHPPYWREEDSEWVFLARAFDPKAKKFEYGKMMRRKMDFVSGSPIHVFYKVYEERNKELRLVIKRIEPEEDKKIISVSKGERVKSDFYIARRSFIIPKGVKMGKIEISVHVEGEEKVKSHFHVYENSEEMEEEKERERLEKVEGGNIHW